MIRYFVFFFLSTLILSTLYASPAYADTRAGKIIVQEVSRDDKILEQSNIPPAKYKNVPPKAKIGIYYPKKFTLDKSWPLFLAMEPGAGNGLAAIGNYIRFADEIGFIVAAVELDAEIDIEEARYYYILFIIEHLRREALLGKKPIWIGGFSGGAKWALHIGAYGGDVFSGILATGCNNDFATIGYNEMGNESALDVPIYLLNGAEDGIAGTKGLDYKFMFWTMKSTGFKNIRLVEYKGGHQIPYRETLEAFIWLKNYAKQRYEQIEQKQN